MLFLKGKDLLKEALDKGPSTLSGVHSSKAFQGVLKEFFSNYSKKKVNLLLFANEDSLDDFLKDSSLNCTVLRGFGASPYSGMEPSSRISPSRIHFLNSLLLGQHKVYATYTEALLFKTLSPKELSDQTKTFEFADSFFEDPSAELIKLGYNPTQFVEKPGQFSDKGGIIDVFSPAHNHPHRIELFGQEIESLRAFSTDTQRSLEECTSIILSPAHECVYNSNNKAEILNFLASIEGHDTWKKEIVHKVRNEVPFSEVEFFASLFSVSPSSALDYFDPAKTNLIEFDSNQISNTWNSKKRVLEGEYESFDSSYPRHLEPYQIYKENYDASQFKSRVDVCSVLVSDLEDYNSEGENNKRLLNYSTTNIKTTLDSLKKKSTSWNDFSDESKKLLNMWTSSGNAVFICCKSDNSLTRLSSILKDWSLPFEKIDSDLEEISPGLYTRIKKINDSTKFNDEKFIQLRFEDFFGKERHKEKQKNSHKEYFEKLEALKIGEISPGDLVVHIQHGVGVFKGLKLIELQGVPSECLEVQYDGKDKLFLPTHKIHQLKKYSGNSTGRSLDKLGGQYWQKTKSKVKSKLKEIAADLIQLYAKRKSISRKPIISDKNNLTLFENQFPFQETRDQQEAIDAVLADFERDFPMERLVCGDVGFGKTEVAMRAAFVALSEGKQVVVLAPTTVLSMQHFESFKKRFQSWPFEIRSLNRFVTKAEAKKSLELLKKGRVDMVIGTHRVLSTDVEFKDLGLLIVDEEQKFGVRQKEKIKQLKANVDVLALSATPIPRTLNMGFLGVRDLSLISTPPKDRLPIKTFVSHYSLQMISQAIENELKRGGQVYFVHNRVQSIYQLYSELKEAMPNVRIGLGHGQMAEKDLEEVMVKFFNKEIDVLLSTTIIESGVDVSTANTMIINNAQNFGLSQLYQLRGRVGRSEQRAFCYLLIPQNKDLEKAQKEKLKVLQDHTALGSGLQIAHYDLELRGAGNLLGESQSGHAEAIGYDFYIELLEEAMAESRGDEISQVVDPEINVPLPALIPDTYMPDLKTRLYYYRKLNKIESEEQLDGLEFELKDQFGAIPDEVVGLFFLSATKNICRKMGVKDLKAGPKNISLQFVDKPNINHDRLFALIKKQPKKYKLSPDQRILIAKEKPVWNEIYEEVSILERDLLI